MKIECLKENLQQAVAVTEKIAGTNLTLPILNCVLLEVRGDILKVRSTNLDIGIEASIPVKKESDGIVAVPASVLYNTLQNTFDPTVVLEVKDTNLIVTTKNSNTIINTYQSDDFPSLPTLEGTQMFLFKSKDLLQGIQSVVYSASTSTIKPELSSVYIYERDKKVYFVSTDSFRLAEKKIASKQKQPLPQSFIIPLRNALELARILNYVDGETEVSMKMSENQFSLEFDSIFVTSRLIDGVFPDYKQIIPKEHTTTAVILKQDLLNIFKKINIFSDKFGQVSVVADPKKKLLTLVAKNVTVGETRDSVDAAVAGEKVEMNFNYRYIVDSLSSIHSDSVTLYFTGVGKPLVIKGVSDETFLYLVMPMNK